MTVYLGKNPVGIGRIVEKQVAKKKYGATVDAFFGDVDANGILSAPTEQVDLVFDGVREIGSKGLYYTFFGSTNISSVDFSSLQSVDNNGLYCTFYNCTNLANVDFSSLTTVGSYGLNSTFYGCSGIKSVDLSLFRVLIRMV